MQWTTCWKSGLSLTHERTDPTFAVFKQFEPFHHGGVASACFTISLVSRLALVKPESTIVNIFNGADETRWNDRAISGIMTVINVVIGMAIELDYWLPSCASCQNGKQRRCDSVLVVVINFFRERLSVTKKHPLGKMSFATSPQRQLTQRQLTDSSSPYKHW